MEPMGSNAAGTGPLRPGLDEALRLIVEFR